MAQKRVVKSELVSIVAHQLGMPKVEVDKVLDACIEVIEDNIIKGNRILLTRFGSFDTRIRSARQFHNPLTREHLNLSSTIVPTFRFSSVLVDKVKETFG